MHCPASFREKCSMAGLHCPQHLSGIEAIQGKVLQLWIELKLFGSKGELRSHFGRSPDSPCSWPAHKRVIESPVVHQRKNEVVSTGLHDHAQCNGKTPCIPLL